MRTRARDRRRYSGATVSAVTWPWKSWGEPSALPRTVFLFLKYRKRREWMDGDETAQDKKRREEEEKGRRVRRGGAPPHTYRIPLVDRLGARPYNTCRAISRDN